MTTVLRFMLDDLINETPPGIRRYGCALAAALIQYAPPDCVVEGVTARRAKPILTSLREQIPGLDNITSIDISPAALRQAIVKGRAGRLVPPGLIHSPTLMAPLYPRRRTGAFHQTVVTWHSALPTLTFTPTGKPTRQTRSLMERISRYADAVIVSSQAEAEALDAMVALGDRLRIIPGAPALTITDDDPDASAKALNLPTRYFAVFAPDTEATHAVYRAMALVKKPINVVMLTPGPAPEQLTKPQRERLYEIDSADPHAVAIALTQATAAFYLSPHDQTLFSVHDAMAHAIPLVYEASDELTELTGATGYPLDPNHITGTAIAEAMDALAFTRKLPTQLTVAAHDYVDHFSWQSTAEQVWRLHAEL